MAGCGESGKNEAWFDDQAERDHYRDHMMMLLEHYQGATAIAWFEYSNEPKLVEDGRSARSRRGLPAAARVAGR